MNDFLHRLNRDGLTVDRRTGVMGCGEFLVRSKSQSRRVPMSAAGNLVSDVSQSISQDGLPAGGCSNTAAKCKGVNGQVVGLRVRGQLDPQLPSRLLGLIAMLNRLPLEFHFAQIGPELCQVDFSFEASAESCSRRMLTQILKIPSVLEAGPNESLS